MHFSIKIISFSYFWCMKQLIIVLFIVPLLSFSQTKEEMDLCMALQVNNFSSNEEADDALQRILDVIGASKNFVLTPCDKISNAIATAYKGTRYILYDREFMRIINTVTNDWSNLFIFAHEVGHHINGHSIDLLLYNSEEVNLPSFEKKRQQELEADEFAAFVLAKLGAKLSQLNDVISLISNNSEDTYSTHPKKKKRLASIKKGYNKGNIKSINKNSKDRIVKESKPKKIKEIYLDYDDKSKFIQSKYWKRLVFNDPFNEIAFEALIENINSPKFSIKKTKSGEYIFGLYNLDSIFSEKSKTETIDFVDKYAEIPGFIRRDLPIHFSASLDVIILNSNEKEIFNSTLPETINFFTYKISKGFNQLHLDDANSVGYMLSYFTGPSLNLLKSRIGGIGFFKQQEVKKLLNFISALKSGNKLLIRFNFYFPNWNKTTREYDYKSKSFFTQPTLEFIETSRPFEYSLSGSSKALED